MSYRQKKNGLTSLKGDPRVENYTVVYDRWIFGVLHEAGPVALNLISDYGVPKGNPVPTPEILKHLPLKPPGR